MSPPESAEIPLRAPSPAVATGSATEAEEPPAQTTPAKKRKQNPLANPWGNEHHANTGWFSPAHIWQDSTRPLTAELIEHATVNCYNNSEAKTRFLTMIEDNLTMPFTTNVLGAEVEGYSVELQEVTRVFCQVQFES